jgi:hypothetical protein
MSYGQNIILAMGMFGGYNQEDGIIMNADALARGQFRSINYRSYEMFEEDDPKSRTQIRIGNPKQIPGWNDLKPNLDYSKLDDTGLIRVGEYVDQNTVIVGGYMISDSGQMKDSSKTPQVWTRGRVESVVVTVNNAGLRLVKVRVTQDRVPELGDKFCLTDDHDVLTKNRGWVSIADVTIHDQVAQLNKEKNVIEYVQPKETFVFEHTGQMYEVKTVVGSQYVTAEHRLYVAESEQAVPELVPAIQVYKASSKLYHIITENNVRVPIMAIEEHETNRIGNKVYCISVPSEIFLIRRKGCKSAVWTGNSNRHGQKGTINVLYRATDMPRTADGITPDMIMNPTAIPSRMTIGQILEMICGNVSAELAAFTNVTAFMNDGSPHEMLGNILEKLGLNRMCNQILYNGMTGEQIQADIFMGVVYGMRLKHMTEDKWNARGQGRREQRTHQPTGGRGNEGGMKLGEMERDAIIAHGISAFQNESYMLRSDGTTFTVCNGCGTIPIYNERQDLYICPLCDGRIEYSGDTANDLAPIPPSTRSATSFSKIQFPYATKLFMQEMETFANMGMRILTTRDTQRLRGLDHVTELTVAKGAVAQPLQNRVYEQPEVPALQNAKPVPTAAEIAREMDMLQAQAVQTFQQDLQLQAANTIAGQPATALQQEASQIIQGLAVNQVQPLQQQQQGNQYQAVGNQFIQLMPGSVMPAAAAGPAAIPGQPPVELVTEAGAPVINIDTTPAAMAAAGLRQPGDATAAIQPPPMMAYPPPPPMNRPPPRRRARLIAPGQQQGGYGWQPQQQQPSYPPMNDGQQANDGGMPMPQQYAQEVKVEKLG